VTADMWLGVLGPFCVRQNGAAVLVPAARQRAVLAVLAVRAGQVVSFEELAETVWDGVPPAGARGTLRGYVKRLRRVLGPELADRLVTREPGYLLDAADDEVDLLAFDLLCAQGSAAVRVGEWQRAWRVLDQAVALWRGEPLADLGCEALRRELLPRLASQRLQAIEWRADAGLELGRHGELVAVLTGLASEHPLRERFCAQLMLALYRCGRQGEALAVYQRTRRVLASELAVEPGPELRELQQRILTADPSLRSPAAEAGLTGVAGRAGPAVVVPRQLPTAVGGFVGRAVELAALDAMAEDGTDAAGWVVISALCGTAGVGKTALAVHWAHRVADRFPDGQLYVNLRGFDPAGAPMAAGDVLRQFLAALAVPAERIPIELGAQAGLYRSLLAGRRMLVLLDNARDADQVRPLLPAGPGCLVVVTSRTELAGLVATEGANMLALDVLSQAEARELLARRLGAGRTAAEPEAVDELIDRCARLPLALSIAAARASIHRGQPLAALLAQLRDARDRLDALTAGEPATDLRAVFSWSYLGLTAPAARMFRLLGLHPGPDLTVAAAASLAGTSPLQARRAVRELTSAHLLAEHTPGRFGFHDLLRTYAAEQAQLLDAAGERRSAVRRTLDHYLHTAWTADHLLHPARSRITLAPPQPGVAAEQLTEHGQALTWFEAEHRVLVGAVAQAGDQGFDTHTWQLSWTLRTFFYRRGHWRDWGTTQHLALAAAERLGDQSGQAHALRDAAAACTELGRYGEAHAHLDRALRLREKLGDDEGRARIHLDIARVLERQDSYREALGHAQQALDCYEATGDGAGQANALNAIGWYHAHLGDHSQALRCCQQALDLHHELGDRQGEAATWDSLGYINRLLGDHTQEAHCYRRALDLYTELGERYYRADALIHVGDACQATADPRAASQAWQQALTILDELQHPDAEGVRRKLHDLHRTEVRTQADPAMP